MAKMEIQPFILAIISLVGVIISVVTSYIVSKRTAELKVKEIEEAYSQVLYKKRIDTYPLFYGILGKMASEIFYADSYPTKEEMIKFQSDIADWDENFAVYTGQSVVRSIYTLRQYLRDMLSEIDEKDYEKECKSLYSLVNKLEFEIKLELGVFKAEDFQGTRNNIKDIKDYDSSFFDKNSNLK